MRVKKQSCSLIIAKILSLRFLGPVAWERPGQSGSVTSPLPAGIVHPESGDHPGVGATEKWAGLRGAPEAPGKAVAAGSVHFWKPS